MNTTLVLAAMGFIATLLSGYLGALWQQRGSRDAQLRDATIRVYGECAASLYEYERSTYDRVKARMHSKPEAEREPLRQAAYRANTSARSAIGQLRVLVSGSDVLGGLDRVRQLIGDYNGSSDQADLKLRHEVVHAELTRILIKARADLNR